MLTVLERLHTAINQHDLEAMLECFDPEYRSEQPRHPNRGFGGKEQVRKNWSRMLDSFPISRPSCWGTPPRGNGVEQVAVERHGVEHDGGDPPRGKGGTHRLGSVVHGANRRRR